MLKIPRGFLFVRNKKSGEILPYFIHVREDDIYWNTVPESGWTVRNYDNIKQVDLQAHMSIPELTIESSRKVSAKITLPVSLGSRSIIQVTKFSNGNSLLENSVVEAQLDDYTGETTNILSIYFINSSSLFTEENITSLTGKLNISIRGFLE